MVVLPCDCHARGARLPLHGKCMARQWQRCAMGYARVCCATAWACVYDSIAAHLIDMPLNILAGARHHFSATAWQYHGS